MDFLLDIGSFLLQALILLAVFLVAVAGVVAISQRKRGSGDDGYIEARLLNDRYEAHQESLRAVTEDEADAKAREKAKKKSKASPSNASTKLDYISDELRKLKVIIAQTYRTRH